MGDGRREKNELTAMGGLAMVWPALLERAARKGEDG